MSTPVETVMLTKKFQETTALHEVTLSLPKGSIVGLIGANGAGKTTLLRSITGMLIPTFGEVTTLGVPASGLDAARLNRIGALDQEIRLLDFLTVEQHLRYVAGFYDHWDRDLEAQLLERFELSQVANVDSLSGGNRQKLALLLALCHRPELILLDEPVSAMDPIVRERILEYLLEAVREQETTIVISSHVLRDVEKVVDHVVCMAFGRITLNSPVHELQEQYREWVVAPAAGTESELPEVFTEPYVEHITRANNRASLIVRTGAEPQAFRERYRVDVIERHLSLERTLLHLLEKI